jgi:competence protein ComEC
VRPLARALTLASAALALVVGCRSSRTPDSQSGRELVVSRMMADPRNVPDDRGEWIEIANVGRVAANLRGWSLRSANDAGYEVRESIVIPGGGRVLLARDADARGDADARPALVYTGIVLGNGYDWLVLRDPDDATRDSVAWSAPPRGVALEHRAEAVVATSAAGTVGAGTATAGTAAVVAPPTSDRELVVRMLDVGQGEAIVIQNGGSTVIVDGGPDRRVLARWLDRLALRDTIDVVILTHTHSDHFEGLRELFVSRRRFVIRDYWANGDPAAAIGFSRLPDSVAARARAGQMRLRDTDDGCAESSTGICTLVLRGGAKLHLMRPMPNASGQNDRSAALKLIGPDSASFTMWLAGDAEHIAIDWFANRAGYSASPGMQADVLKANHHGSCDGVSDRYLALVKPKLVVASLGAINDYGHMHAQAKSAYQRVGVPWYRTDQNGTIVLRAPGTPGSGYSVTVERGTQNATGPSDRRSNQPDCSRMR